MKLDPLPTPFTKINSKQNKGLNVTAKTIELLEENTDINLRDLSFGNGFLNMAPKVQATKKVSTLDFIKIENFSASKDIIKKVKRQHREWEKIYFHI